MSLQYTSMLITYSQRVVNLFDSTIAPESTTYSTIDSFLKCEDELERHRLTERWRKHALSEMKFVGLLVRSLLHGMCLSLCYINDLILTNSVFHCGLGHGLYWRLANSSS